MIVPREIRHVQFRPDEVRLALTAFLAQASWTKRVLQVRGIELAQEAAGAFASVVIHTQGGAKSVIVPASDLLVAILLFCKTIRIPLPMVSTKALRLEDGLLVLDIVKDDPGVSDASALAEARAAEQSARVAALNARGRGADAAAS